MDRSQLCEEALRLAATGIPVFPCLPGEKAPATPNGFRDATTDPTQIERWWSEADYNIAFSPEMAGLCVIDTDPPAGEEAWAALETEHGLAPRTWTIRTPRGGLHRYFKGSLPGSVSKLGQNIDTRGVNSYVLVPPSRTKHGLYTAEDASSPVPLPEWVPSVLGARKRDHVATASDDLDQPQNVRRAIYYLEHAEPAVEGEGGDSRTYIVACEVLNYGISEAKALDLIEEHYNPRCIPPWDTEDLEVKIQNAASYAQNEPGAWAVERASVAHGEALGKLLPSLTPARRSKFHLYTLDEVRQLPEPTWLIPDILQERGLGIIYGPPQSYKSFLALDLAATIATGLDAYERGAQPPQDVIYMAAEGFRGQEIRATAWEREHDADLSRLRLTEKAVEVMSADDATEFMQEIEAAGVKPRLIVVDTMSKALIGMNENESRDINQLVNMLEGMRDALDCAVLVIHHTGKDTSRGARGSSAIPGGFDAMLEVEGNDVNRTAQMQVVKQKDAERRKEPYCYEGKQAHGSLVFTQIEPRLYRMSNGNDGDLTGKRIGQALLDLGAKGEANGVSTTALAVQLMPAAPDVSTEDHQEAIGRLSKRLGLLAGSRLEAYAFGDGSERRWYLPA